MPRRMGAMIDRSLVEDPDWVRYFGDLAQHAATQGFGTRLFPVAMEPSILDDLALEEQAIRSESVVPMHLCPLYSSSFSTSKAL